MTEPHYMDPVEILAYRNAWTCNPPKQLVSIETTPFEMKLFFADQTTMTIMPNGFTKPISLKACIETKPGELIPMNISPEGKESEKSK